MLLRDVIIKACEEHCQRAGYGIGVLGLRAVQDHHAVPNIRRGKASLKRCERILIFIARENRRLAAVPIKEAKDG